MKTKNKIWQHLFIIMGLLLILANSCKKDEEPTDKITDKDGNVYTSVTIGTQVWMVENLKTTKYNDGSSIPLVTDNAVWEILTTPAYCWYNNDLATHKDIYGTLYNWHVVNTNKLCPNGWHVPTDNEWTTLTDYLGGEDIAGGKLKETGTTHWNSPNTGATNETGFTALPGGARGYYGPFDNIGVDCNFWSSTEEVTGYAWCRVIWYNYSAVGRGNAGEIAGYSVRCIKD